MHKVLFQQHSQALPLLLVEPFSNICLLKVVQYVSTVPASQFKGNRQNAFDTSPETITSLHSSSLYVIGPSPYGPPEY